MAEQRLLNEAAAKLRRRRGQASARLVSRGMPPDPSRGGTEGYSYSFRQVAMGMDENGLRRWRNERDTPLAKSGN